MTESAHCIFCDRTDESVPLVAFRFRGRELWICSQHLPILIHQPAELAGKLPGADTLEAAAHDD